VYCKVLVGAVKCVAAARDAREGGVLAVDGRENTCTWTRTVKAAVSERGALPCASFESFESFGRYKYNGSSVSD
jgi:hypothetical protein